MTRLAPTDGDAGDATAERIRARRGGELRPLDRMLLHSPPVAEGWNALLGAIRERTTLDPVLRELVILRVAVLNGATYEWAAHEPVARDAGVSEAQLAALRDDPGAVLTDPSQQAAIAYTDAMTRDVRVPEPVFAALREHFDERATVELTATIGAYNLVSRFLVALRIGERP